MKMKISCFMLILLFFLFSCSVGMYNDPNNYQDRNRSDNSGIGSRSVNSGSGLVTGFKYPNGMAKAAEVDPEFLKQEYEDWKYRYVTSSGAGVGNLRVQRDLASDYDTVSEGQAYGMLLAVYFNDKDAFDKLYRYVLAHPANDSDRKKVILMHWKVRKDGTDISEFRIPVPHKIPYMFKADWNKPEEEKRYVDADTVTGTDIDGNPVQAKNDPNYLRAARYDRHAGSATDADLDIAGALVFAHARWGGTYYKGEALKHIAAIMEYDVDTSAGGSSAILKNGTLWGDQQCWNPCYFTPAWFRVFKKFLNDNPRYVNIDTVKYAGMCTDVIDTMYTEMLKIDAINGTAGLYPDWCDTSGAVVKPAKASDRRYFLDEDADGTIDDLNKDGVITYINPLIPAQVANPNSTNWDGTGGDSYNMQSYNFYYDAVRTPWRIGTDHLWYGDTNAKNITQKIANHFNGQITTIVDGYTITGGTWDRQKRDGFNNFTPAENGGQWNSPSFVAMMATASLSINDPANALECYNHVVSKKESYADNHNYYGNSLRLFSLLYLSGNFINLYDLSGYGFDRDPARNITVGPLTIDLAYTDFGVYGTSHCDFHDRAKLFNSDGTTYGRIGSGVISGAGSDQMIVGYGAYVGDIICGLPNLWLRAPRNSGVVLARGTIEGKEYGKGVILDNIKQDPGCMDFSLDMSKFTPDTSRNYYIEPDQALTLAPGNYGSLTLKGRNTLTLSSGYYHFNSISIEPGCKIFFPFQGDPTVLYVKNDFTVKSNVSMLSRYKDSDAGADPSRILVIVGTSNTIYIGPDVSWRGTFIAPNSNYVNIDIRNSEITEELQNNPDPTKWKVRTKEGTVFGAIWGKVVVVHQTCPVYSTPFRWDLLPAMNSDPSSPPGGTVINLGSSDKNKQFTAHDVTTFTIPAGRSGKVQINKAWLADITVSVNGGAFAATPEGWGGEYTVKADATVTIAVKSGAAQTIQFNWW